MKRKILVFLFVLSTLSILYGLISLSRIGYDFQIDNARYLLEGKSPYELYLKNPHLFKFKRIPTILPQGLYCLIPFSLLGDFLGGLFYGIIGLLFFYLCRFIKKENKNYIILFFLLLSTEPYRSNLSLGQSLFFYFPLFIVFDYFMKKKDTKIFNLFINPFILMLLFVKPSLSLWIPFYYGFKRRNLLIYLISFIMQIFLIIIFLLQTGTDIIGFLESYFEIVLEHLRISLHPNFVFSINFSSIIQSITSIFIISIIFMSLIILFLKFLKKKEIPEYQFMFLIILLSFIIFYHSNADIFLLLLPIFSFKVEILKRENIIFLLFFIFLIVEKLILLSYGELTGKLILNFFTSVIIFLITSYIHFYKNETESS